MRTRPLDIRPRALNRRKVLAGLAVSAGSGIASFGSGSAREATGPPVAAPLVAASASDVLVEVLDHRAMADDHVLSLRFTNTGRDAVGIGSGLVRPIFGDQDAGPAGDPSDVCSLLPGVASYLTLSLRGDHDSPLLGVEIGLLESGRTGAMIRLGFAPLRADAFGGSGNTSVRSDSSPSPDSLPICLH